MMSRVVKSCSKSLPAKIAAVSGTCILQRVPNSFLAIWDSVYLKLGIRDLEGKGEQDLRL